MGRNDEKTDADILKGREDILRARRAAATNRQPSDVKSDKSPTQSRASETKKNTPRNIPQEPSEMIKAVVDANRQKRTEYELSDVPAFDVAQKILTQQRRATSAKRTAPTKTRTSESAEPGHIQMRTDGVAYKRPDHHRLVAEIVARDIERFCRC